MKSRRIIIIINAQKPNNFKVMYPKGSETNEPIVPGINFTKPKLKRVQKLTINLLIIIKYPKRNKGLACYTFFSINKPFTLS